MARTAEFRFSDRFWRSSPIFAMRTGALVG
jgi:hypothetical protein